MQEDKMNKRKIIYMIAAIVLSVALLLACGSNNAPPEETVEPIQTTAPDSVPTPIPTPIPTPVPDPNAEMTPLEPTDVEDAADTGDGADAGDATEVLKIEMENERVKELQQLLKDLGYLDKVTGYFGTETEAAVKKFQEKNGLTVDGIVGSSTMAKLKSDDAKKASD